VELLGGEERWSFGRILQNCREKKGTRELLVED